MSKKSKAVLQRIENFDRVEKEMIEQGYQCKKVKIGIVKANIIAILIAIVAILLMVPIYMVLHRSFEASFAIDRETIHLLFSSLIYFAIAIFALCVVHEVLHGITWAHFCKKKWKSVQFGMMWQYITPYCSCLEPLSWKAYIIGGLMPFLVLGIGFFLASLISGSGILLILSIFNIMGAGGDLMVVWKIIRNHEGILMDLPEECGYMQFYKEK